MTDYTGRTARIVGNPMEGNIVVYREPYGEERGRWENMDATDLLAWLRQAGYVVVPVAVAQEWLDARLAHGPEGVFPSYTRAALDRLGRANEAMRAAIAAALKGGTVHE